MSGQESKHFVCVVRDNSGNLTDREMVDRINYSGRDFTRVRYEYFLESKKPDLANENPQEVTIGGKKYFRVIEPRKSGGSSEIMR